MSHSTAHRQQGGCSLPPAWPHLCSVSFHPFSLSSLSSASSQTVLEKIARVTSLRYFSSFLCLFKCWARPIFNLYPLPRQQGDFLICRASPQPLLPSRLLSPSSHSLSAAPPVKDAIISICSFSPLALHNLSLKSCHHLTVLATKPVMLIQVCGCVCMPAE